MAAYIFVLVHLCWSCTFVLIKHVAYLNSVRSRSIENNQSRKSLKPDPDSISNMFPLRNMSPLSCVFSPCMCPLRVCPFPMYPFSVCVPIPCVSPLRVCLLSGCVPSPYMSLLQICPLSLCVPSPYVSPFWVYHLSVCPLALFCEIPVPYNLLTMYISTTFFLCIQCTYRPVVAKNAIPYSASHYTLLEGGYS